MIIRNFEYLLALNQERHFARAAAACQVSQPTLSSGIKQLEEDMDVLIVKRGQRFEGFTEEGARVLLLAQQMLEDCQRLKQELRDLRGPGLQGPFRIGMSPSTAAVVSVLSVSFAEQFPLLQISSTTASCEELMQQLRQGELDMALTHLEPALHEGLETHALYDERLFLLTSDKAHKERVSWEQAAASPLCLLRGAIPAPAQTRLEHAPKLMVTDAVPMVAAHLATKKWATVLPQSLVSQVATAQTVAIPLSPPDNRINIGFVTQKKAALPPAIHAMMELAHTPEMVTAIRALLAAHRAFCAKPPR